MIRIGFSTSSAWYSKVIMAVTGSKSSHTFFVVPFMGVDFVLEEGPHGFFPSRMFHPNDPNLVGVYTPRAPQERLLAAVQAELPDIGTAYGYLVLLGMAVVYLGRWLKKKWKNPFKSGKSFICSERGAMILQAAGEPGTEHMDPSATSPEDLLELYR